MCAGRLSQRFRRACRLESGVSRAGGRWGRGGRPPRPPRPKEKVKLHIYLFAPNKGRPLRGDSRFGVMRGRQRGTYCAQARSGPQVAPQAGGAGQTEPQGQPGHLLHGPSAPVRGPQQHPLAALCSSRPPPPPPARPAAEHWARGPLGRRRVAGLPQNSGGAEGLCTAVWGAGRGQTRPAGACRQTSCWSASPAVDTPRWGQNPGRLCSLSLTRASTPSPSLPLLPPPFPSPPSSPLLPPSRLPWPSLSLGSSLPSSGLEGNSSHDCGRCLDPPGDGPAGRPPSSEGCVSLPRIGPRSLEQTMSRLLWTLGVRVGRRVAWQRARSPQQSSPTVRLK